MSVLPSNTVVRSKTVIQVYASLSHIPALASTPVDMFRRVQNGRQSQSLTEMTFVT